MPLSRRQFLQSTGIAGAAAAASLAASPAAAAAPPKTGAQVAGVYRAAVGSVEVTALSDGYVEIDHKLIPKASEVAVDRLLKEAYLPHGKVRAGVNAYAVHTGDRLVLVDTGGRDLLGPTMGRLPLSMRAAGLEPDDVAAIYLTHMHPDHIGGLTDGDGNAVFANAEIVVAERDWAFWTSDDVMAQAPESAKRFFTAAQKAVEPYRDRVTRFSAEKPLLTPGLLPVALPGHTPGHTGYLVEDGGDQLLIWGDIVHAAVLQFPNPDWALIFDTDQDEAVATRLKAFDMAAADRLMVAGMHLPFPGFGHVARRGESYEYVPAEWQYEL